MKIKTIPPIAILMLAIASITGITACKKEKSDPCLNYYNEKGIQVYDYIADLRLSLRWPEDNESSNWRTLKFESVNEYDEYIWRVGLEDKDRLGKSIIVNGLINDPGSNHTTVRLIGKRTPKPDCQPNDTGIDTFYHKIFIISKSELDNNIYTGYFQGSYIFDPADTFTLAIVNEPFAIGDHDSSYFLIGYPTKTNLRNSTIAVWVRNELFLANGGAELFFNCNCNFQSEIKFDEMRNGRCVFGEANFRATLINNDELYIWANLMATNVSLSKNCTCRLTCGLRLGVESDF